MLNTAAAVFAIRAAKDASNDQRCKLTVGQHRGVDPSDTRGYSGERGHCVNKLQVSSGDSEFPPASPDRATGCKPSCSPFALVNRRSAQPLPERKSPGRPSIRDSSLPGVVT